MKNAQSVLMGVPLAAAALLLVSCAAPETRTGAEMPGGQAAPTDPLQACLAKIPATATAGQRAMAEETCRRNAAARDAVVGAGTAAATSAAASGQAGDTLEACLARIPEDASAGQRMIAEESCKRDAANRKSIESVPGL